MEFSEQDKAVLRMVAELIWRQGIHNPQDSALANAFGNIVNRVHAPVEENKPCSTDVPAQKP